MVYKKSELKSLIDEFIKGVKRKIRVEKVILFGSYAWGRPRAYSDIDLAVISRDFKKLSDLKRIGMLLDVVYKLRMPKLVDVEVLGFTPEELENADYFDIASEIRDKGIVFT